ncbi:MAG: BACON domain-containing carbohydrate-binding protein [Candidatus Zixiibacteriota bacterium]
MISIKNIKILKALGLIYIITVLLGLGCKTEISAPPPVDLELCTSDTVWNAGGRTEPYEIDLAECNGPLRLKYKIDSDADWIATSDDSGITPAHFSISLDENKTGSSRTGLLTIFTPEIPDSMTSIQINQTSLQTEMCVSESTWTACGAIDTSEFVTITDCNLMGVFDWTVTSDSSWISTSINGDDTPGSFTIMVDSNKTGAPRSANLIVSAVSIPGSPDTIHINQNSLETALCLSLDEILFDYTGSTSDEIHIYDCNGERSFDWVIADNANWITTSISDGTAPSSFTITANPNESGSSRAGTITITATGIEGSPKTINVIQLHSDPYSGRLRIYMTEHISRFNMYNGDPYHFGFLGFAFNDTFTIDIGQIFDTTITWTYAGITQTNVYAIAAVFNDSGYQQISNEPYTPAKYFTAYNVDACAGSNYANVWPNTTAPGFTHTVFCEKGTATWCVNCPKTAVALDEIYHDHIYPFFWVSLIEDVIPEAHYRYYTELGRFGDPTSYFDGGYEVLLGGYDTTHLDLYQSLIESAGAREVRPLNLTVDLDWLGNETVSVHLILESPIIIEK